MTGVAAYAYMQDSAYETPVSASASSLQVQWGRAISHAEAPITRASIALRFEELAETWIEERGPTSSMTEILLSPSYQRIIALGPQVVPFILRELERRPDHWFWALEILTGANPVPAAHAGRIRLMAADWLNWASTQRIAA